MLIVKYIAKLIKILRSAATPGQIAGGVILGMIPGLTPVWSLHNLLVLLNLKAMVELIDIYQTMSG